MVNFQFPREKENFPFRPNSRKMALFCIFILFEIIFHSQNSYLFRIQLYDFWCPLTLKDFDGSIKRWELPKGRYDFLLKNSAGLRFQAEEVRQLISRGLIESPSMTSDESLKIVRVQDQLRKLLGVHFPEDDLEY